MIVSSIQHNRSIQHSVISSDLSSDQSGFSLLELLISLAIFAIGILGLVTLQSVSIKMTHDIALQNTALELSSSLIEQLRVAGAPTVLPDWQERVQETLPHGQAQLIDQGDHYQLKMQWHESELSSDSSNLQVYDMTFKLKP